MGLFGKILDIGEDIEKTVSNVATDVEKTVSNIVTDVEDTVSNAVKDVDNSVSNVVDGAVDATENVVGSAEKAVTTLVKSGIKYETLNIEHKFYKVEEVLTVLGVMKQKTTTGAEKNDPDKSIEDCIDSFKADMEKGRDKNDPKGTGNYAVDFLFDVAGFTIDEKQEIYTSNKYPPIQRMMGYNDFYDEASTPLLCSINCEPIYFDYGGKNWRIELWKGQYGLATGCEIGIYTKRRGAQTGQYDCASQDDWLPMSLDLYKNGQSEPLFHRESDGHWWLTGFKPGEYARPEDLTMRLSITLKDTDMRHDFVDSLGKMGYKKVNEIKNQRQFLFDGNKVTIDYGKPQSPQPCTSEGIIKDISMDISKQFCNGYNLVKDGYEIYEADNGK